MSLSLTILGCHSATPRVNAFPTAQYLEINNSHFLIDCGEGTQRQMRKYKVGFSKINHIFISHLHGDHFFGLVGLLSTYGILSREKELHIYGPKGIKEVTLLQLKISQSHAQYPLIFHELTSKESELIFEDDKVSVRTIPLNHRVYTNGYLFTEKERPRKLHMQNISNYEEIDKADYLNIKAGKDVILSSGEMIPNSELTLPQDKNLSFAFCSDTKYKPDIIPIIKNVDLLYHEATFLSDREDLAKKTKHATSKQAAQIAKDAEVGQLIIGHYSGRYKDISLFQKEAKEIFENTNLAEPGKIFKI
ncbi:MULTISPECIES: ribonuclease Z [unclassified Polaribacter]|jgi:ribonuclease Z|uniref:ribonuclease Z n=1 Tax=unclassified Polaribacter TaxID=196858 RepID=UPI00052DE491|nr:MULTISPECIES: ribonuclease Z [unclassified Polaribacter]KGL59785.1 ribonuclease Z [Polaribacter sp. Hel1_33_49]MBT3741873.1 ribonuclease Z [Polaribacter sp.]MBT4412664.1 ribonuclease Z [Polaribacter sp.]MDG1402961.1 ribonuclease Z [Polaribacter sp.]PKV64283.1 RNAse Z [Polaribacter sp. Hel1_33_96]